MTAQLRGRLLTAAGAVLVTIAVAGALVLRPSAQDVVVLAAGLALAGVLVFAPVQTLPAWSIGLFVFVPQQAVGFLNGASPAALALGVWAIRRILAGGAARGDALLTTARIAIVGAVVWCGWLLTQSPDAGAFQTGVYWTISLVLAVVLPLLAGETSRELEVLWRVWPIVTVVAAAYVAVEYAVGANFLYGRVYDIVGRPIEQDWSLYRAHGSFGHPLYAATYFAVSTAAALARYVTTPRAPWLWIVMGAGALTLTISRSALTAAAVAAVAVFVLAPILHRRRTLPGYLPALALSVVAAGVVLASGLLQSRSGSSEASSSSDARADVIDIVFAAARASDWLGTGPGTADSAIGSWNDQQYAVESSPLQLLLSLGIPGALLISIVIVVAAAAALRLRNLPMLVALMTFVIATAGYNAIESLLPLQALLGVVLVLCFNRRAAPR